MNMNAQYVMQLDYIKILLEDGKDGEALNSLRDMCSQVERGCKVTASRLDGTILDMPKALVKTKPMNWLFLNETWLKLLSLERDSAKFEVTNGISITNKITIDGKPIKAPAGR
jgi:hypothetical protein